MKRFALVAVAAVGMLAAPSALADGAAPAPGLASKGNFFVSAERMFGLSFNSTSSEETVGNNTVKQTNSRTDFSLLMPISGFFSPYMIPRVGLDFAVIDGLTVGGAIGFGTGSSKVKSESGGQSVESDGPKVSTFLISPRVGYILPLGENMGLWLRGGITYYRLGSESENTTGGATSKSTSSNSGMALSLDPSFVFTPVPHFGFYGGVMADIGLSGKDKSERTTGGTTQSVESDLKYHNFGVNFGLVGYL